MRSLIFLITNCTFIDGEIFAHFLKMLQPTEDLQHDITLPVVGAVEMYGLLEARLLGFIMAHCSWLFCIVLIFSYGLRR